MRILILEEKNQIQSLSDEVLKLRPNWGVFQSISSTECLTTLVAFGDRYDVILANMQMSDMDGFRFRRMISQRKIRTPVVFLSVPFRSMINESVRLGVSDIIPRSSGIKTICESLEKAYLDSKVFLLKEEYVAPLAKLCFSLNDHDYCRFLCSDYMVGRDSDCDIRIKLPKVSRRHFTLSRDYKLNLYVLIDLSTNGVEINGQKISSYHRLAHDDRISIPGCDLRLTYLHVIEDMNKTESDNDQGSNH